MSLLRLTPRRPLAALCGAPVRALSTTPVRHSNGSGDATTALFNTVMANAGAERQSPLHRREPVRQPQPQAREPTTSTPDSTPSRAAFAQNIIKDYRANTAEMVDVLRLRSDLELQSSRRWQVGDVYAPHDLTGVEARKWKRSRRTPNVDAFETLGINPIKEYKNFAIMSEYITELGRIRHSKHTGLKPRTHRKMAKAVRRAIGIGIMPSVHIHPELIKPSHGATF